MHYIKAINTIKYITKLIRKIKLKNNKNLQEKLKVGCYQLFLLSVLKYAFLEIGSENICKLRFYIYIYIF